MGAPGQEYYSGLPFPSTEDLPRPGTEPESRALAGGFFTTEPPGESLLNCSSTYLSPQQIPAACVGSGLAPQF